MNIDPTFLIATALFFALTWGLILGCERLQ